MWTITLIEADECRVYVVLAGPPLVVGRKDADILVQSDASISRRHAMFMLDHPEANLCYPHKPPVLTLQDVSKLGTSINGEPFKGETKTVNSGDVVSFGTIGQNKFRVTYDPLVLTTSCLAGPAKRGVKQLTLTLGGHSVGEWRKECQLLVMSSLSVTVKVICALVSLRPIVTPQYLEDLITSVREGTPRPDTDSYLPTLAESQLDASKVSFKPNAARQTLFEGKVFIFLSPKQFKKLSMVIELSGGTPMLMEEGTDDNEDDILVGGSTCVMACDPQDVTQMSPNAQVWIDHVLNFLSRHGKRPITDPEIGYAMLYCSTEKFCNPDNHDMTQSSAPRHPWFPSPCPRCRPRVSLCHRKTYWLQIQRSQSSVPRDPLVPQSLSQMPAQSQSVPPEDILAPDTEMDITIVRHERNPGDVTHVNETRLEVKIKEEPMSQVIPITPARNAKRTREVELSPPPEPKRRSRDIKTEPATPQRGPSPARNTRSRSRSPAPAEGQGGHRGQTSARETRSRSKSPGPNTSRRGQTTVRETRSRSKSPVPQSTRPSRGPAVKPETVDYDDIDDLDSIPTRGRRRGMQAVTEPEPSQTGRRQGMQAVTEPEPSQTGRGRASVKQESNDIFDEIPSRKRGRNATQQAPPTNQNEANISTNQKPDIKNIGKAENSTTAVNSVEEVTEQEDIPSRRSQARNEVKTSRSSEVKTEVIEDTEDSRREVYRREPVTPTEGFISTESANQNGHSRISEFSAKQEDLPSKCANIQDVSLVARPPGTRQREQLTSLGNNTCMWKGKRMKNFKKFKKVQSSEGSLGLPTIIGGSDLIVHQTTPREELEEWFREEMQVESQQNEIQQLANEMFEWEPPSNRKRRQ